MKTPSQEENQVQKRNEGLNYTYKLHSFMWLGLIGKKERGGNNFFCCFLFFRYFLVMYVNAQNATQIGSEVFGSKLLWSVSGR